MSATVPGSGPLGGISVLDVSSLGPGPFCSMLLADYGADVVSVERPHRESFDPSGFFSRGKRSITVDLRAPGGADVIRRLAATADVFLEGYRPGTMERRGLGPEVLLADNPRLIYTRLTGYGQHGPYARRAGHDINYLALAGALGAIGTDRPTPPLNILGDFASGSLLAALGIVLAVLERERTGTGHIVDAAMIDGAALLLTAQLAEHSAGLWHGRGTSVLSGNAPFYGVYPCADGTWFAVGAIETRFYDAMLGALGLRDTMLPPRDDPTCWPQLRARIAEVFRTEPRAHWEKRFAGIDGCGSPVLDLDELAGDPHLTRRGTITTDAQGHLRAGIAPRLSAGTPIPRDRATGPGHDTTTVLTERGFVRTEIAELTAAGVIHCPVTTPVAHA